jgi:5-methylcytosine-specific restriction endonuclease McrA
MFGTPWRHGGGPPDAGHGPDLRGDYEDGFTDSILYGWRGFASCQVRNAAPRRKVPYGIGQEIRPWPTHLEAGFIEANRATTRSVIPEIAQPQFRRRNGRRLFGETRDGDGQPIKIWLQRAGSTPIKRHIKVKSEANPYDPAWEPYFEQREGAHMLESFRGRSMLRSLWYSQRGLCPVCHEQITQRTGWRLHYCLARALGGSTRSENRVLLHPECHSTVHAQGLTVSKPRFLGSVRRA